MMVVDEKAAQEIDYRLRRQQACPTLVMMVVDGRAAQAMGYNRRRQQVCPTLVTMVIVYWVRLPQSVICRRKMALCQERLPPLGPDHYGFRPWNTMTRLDYCPFVRNLRCCNERQDCIEMLRDELCRCLS